MIREKQKKKKKHLMTPPDLSYNPLKEVRPLG